MGGGASVDLANYALISQLPDLTNYALKSEIPTVPSLTGYALTSQLPDLTSYALKSEIPTQNFISLSANQTLERNKNYFANTSGLICSLPSALSVGDIVNLATGNYTFRVNHGNSSQLILNLSTQSTVGADNGIILKAYSSVQLMFVGSNLWVTNFRSRTINNWVVPAVEATAGIKPYAASALEAYTYYTGYELNKINDGSISIGTLKTGGGTPFEFRVLITFAASTILTSLNYWLGQFNGAFNFPSSVDIYLGAILDPLNKIATLSFVGSSGSLSVPNTNQSTQYVLNFKSTTSSMNTAIQEIQAVGRQVVGGELMVV